MVYAILLEGQELGACVDCGRPLNQKGEPVGTIRADGSVHVAVIQLVSHVPPPPKDLDAQLMLRGQKAGA